MISIIIPVYNAEKYIERAIKSILASTYTDFELIIVNDGSKDKTSLILESYKSVDSRIKIIDKKNGGSASARNIGLENAKGEYICFVDADDFIHKDYLKILHNLITKNDADLVECDFYSILENDEIVEEKYNNESIDFSITNNIGLLEQFCDRSNYLKTCVLWNKIYKKELFNNLKFIENKGIDDEYIIYKIIYRCNKIVTTNLKLYFYYISDSSQMRAKPSLKRLDIIDVIEKQMDFFEEKNLIELKEKLYYRYYRSIIDSINFLKKYFPNETEKIKGLKLKRKSIYKVFLSKYISIKEKCYILMTLLMPNISIRLHDKIVGENKISVVK